MFYQLEMKLGDLRRAAPPTIEADWRDRFSYGQLLLPPPLGPDSGEIVRHRKELAQDLVKKCCYRGVFTTGLESKYELVEGGSTRRTQFRHIREFDEPKVHPPSDFTLFTAPSDVAIKRFTIALEQKHLRKLSGKDEYGEEELLCTKAGSLAWISAPLPEFPRLSPLVHAIPFEVLPRIGLAPLELWWEESGKLSWHGGHKIVSCKISRMGR